MKKFSVLFTLFVIFIPKFLFSYSLSVKGLNKIYKWYSKYHLSRY